MTTSTKVTELEEINLQYRTKQQELEKLEVDDEAKPEDREALQAELDQLHGKAMKMRQEIEEGQKVARSKEMGDLDDWLNKPQRQTPHPLNDDADGRKMLSRRGWDCKNGIILAPTSVGKTVEMFEEQVLFGEMPEDDPEAYKYFKSIRGAFQPDYRLAYVKYLRNCYRHRSEAMAFQQLNPSEQKALSEGQDTAGGFLVPVDVQAEILVRSAQMSVMRRLARIITTSRDQVRFPRVQAKATDGSIYSSGFVGGWVGDTPAFSDTDPAFGTFEVSIKKARVATKLGNDFLADAAANVLAFLAQNGAENLALVEDNGFIAGLGTALEPLGILNGGASTVDVESSVDNEFHNTSVEAAAATGSAPKVINLAYTLPSQYADRAQWLCRRAVEGEIRKFEDANGRPLWPPMAGSGLAAAPREVLGYPINNSEFMPAIGADAKILIFGDFSAYIIANRASITSVVLRERFADTDQTGIILFERVGGALWNEDAIRIGALS